MMRRTLQDMRFYGFEGRGVVGETLRREMFFQLAKERIAGSFGGAFESYALVVVRAGGRRGAEIRAAQAAQARENFP